MPNRKPDHVKALAGTLRKSRAAREQLERLTRAPQAPTMLSAGAAAEWPTLATAVVAVGVTAVDVRALVLLAECLATERSLRATIDAEGTTIATGGEGGRKAHPALGALATARTQAHRLLLDFGLVPKGRASLPPPPSAKRPNPFNNLGGGR